MKGFKNSTKTQYFSGGEVVSRNDTRTGSGPMSKKAMPAKFMKGGEAAILRASQPQVAQPATQPAAQPAPQVVSPNKPVSPGGLSTSDPRLRTQTVKPVSPGKGIRKPLGATTLPQATDPVRPRPGPGPKPQGDVRKPMGQGQALREHMMAVNPGKPATRPNMPGGPKPQGDVRKPMVQGQALQGQALRQYMMADNPGKPATRPQPMAVGNIANVAGSLARAPMKKGGSVKKGEQKIGRVMKEFTEGKLHSGSKQGPKVKSTKQAVAIALNEARAAGAKIPRVKKAEGGGVKAMNSDRELSMRSPEAADVLMARMTKDEMAMGKKGIRMAEERMARERKRGVGAISDREMRVMQKEAIKPMAPKKAVPSTSTKPMFGPAKRLSIPLKRGGLSVMPKNKGGMC